MSTSCPLLSLLVTLEPYSSSFGHACRPSLKVRGRSRSLQRERWGATHLLQISKALHWSAFCSPAVFSWAFSSLTCYVSSL